ncbi:hypothetical protein AA313_de0209534 [Arthrobotrys entomopaga]|nr:hypothetical protein AA313_de0209534 [Arthrobotrys entomopaga]
MECLRIFPYAACNARSALSSILRALVANVIIDICTKTAIMTVTQISPIDAITIVASAPAAVSGFGAALVSVARQHEGAARLILSTTNSNMQRKIFRVRESYSRLAALRPLKFGD